MSPTKNQLRNLCEMTAILSGNRKATILAHSLWEFFNYQLYCTIRDDDGEPSRHRLDLVEIGESKAVGDVRVLISLRRTERKEEALVHELLHANLIPLGYPNFRIRETESEKWILAKGITNNADHVAMLPTYLLFGYSKDRFLGPSKSLNDREKRVITDLERMAADLWTPDGYLACVSTYLARHNINFEAIHLADTIIKKRTEG
jgi:hypothetical protein